MKKIIIIHRSAIVCRGLTDVIKGFFNIDVLTFATLSDLSINLAETKKLIVFTEPVEVKQINQIRNLKSPNPITLICVEKDNHLKNNSLYDDSISLWAEPGDIYNSIYPYLALNNTGADESQNSKLTIRETDVLREVSKGLTNKEIADKLHISIHTVISHRKNITAKLGIKSISGLTVYAIINNIVDTNTIDPNTLI